jgi:hypothetical protein
MPPMPRAILAHFAEATAVVGLDAGPRQAPAAGNQGRLRPCAESPQAKGSAAR